MDHLKFGIFSTFFFFYNTLFYLLLVLTLETKISSSLTGINDLCYFIQLLLVRHQFKIAFFNELRQDPHSAIK